MPLYMPLYRRRELAETPGITLDGKPARLSGTLNDFPTVCDTTDHARRVEYSWATVERVIAKGGAFKS